MKIRGQEVIPIETRLKRMISIDTLSGCWNWQGSTRNGYGRLIIGSRTDGSRKSAQAHRVSYEAFIGAIPEGLEVCHRCDNPSCINPDHLFSGTRQDNIDDRQAKGRNNPPKGETHPMAKLTAIDVLSMRRLRSTGQTYQSIADRFGVNKKTAMQAIKLEQWAHVVPPVVAPLPEQGEQP
jgi:hypothetical protein